MRSLASLTLLPSSSVMLPKNIATTPARAHRLRMVGYRERTREGRRTGGEDELVEVDLVYDRLCGRRELQPVQELKPLREDGPEYRACVSGAWMSTLLPPFQDAGDARTGTGNEAGVEWNEAVTHHRRTLLARFG